MASDKGTTASWELVSAVKGCSSSLMQRILQSTPRFGTTVDCEAAFSRLQYMESCDISVTLFAICLGPIHQTTVTGNDDGVFYSHWS